MSKVVHLLPAFRVQWPERLTHARLKERRFLSARRRCCVRTLVLGSFFACAGKWKTNENERLRAI